jgi:hypothetical protein
LIVYLLTSIGISLLKKQVFFLGGGGGKYFVFDLLENTDAVHEMFMYINSNYPRMHELSEVALT